jgi:hypothetical protein
VFQRNGSHVLERVIPGFKVGKRVISVPKTLTYISEMRKNLQL